MTIDLPPAEQSLELLGDRAPKSVAPEKIAISRGKMMKSIKPASVLSTALLVLMAVDVSGAQAQPQTQDLGALASQSQKTLDCMFASTPTASSPRRPECANVQTVDERLAAVGACSFTALDNIVLEATNLITGTQARWDAFFDNWIGVTKARSAPSEAFLKDLPDAVAKSKQTIADLKKQLADAERRQKDRAQNAPQDVPNLQAANEALAKLIKSLQGELEDNEDQIKRQQAAGREVGLDLETSKDQAALYQSMKNRKGIIAKAYTQLLNSKKQSKLRGCTPPTDAP